MRSMFRFASAVVVLILLVGCGGAPSGISAPTNVPAAAPTTVPADALTAAPAAAGELTVFAAASLTEAFGEIGKNFEAANPGTKVTFNFAGSQQLAQQIAQGAPADLFASANRTQMNSVIKSGQVVSGSERVFVRNRLVVITPKENPADMTSLQDLAQSGVKLVLADKSVPVGQYSLDFLAKASALPEYTASYSPTVLANVVSYEENVRSVLAKVALGEGDAGIIYTSDLVGKNASEVTRIDIPDELNTVAAYPVAPINGGPNGALAERFIGYVLSTEGQAILAKYGFLPAA